MSIAKNSAYNLAGSLAPILVSLAVVPFYLETIGLQRYGLLALCWTLLGHLGFLSLGLGPAVAQKLARLRRSGDPDQSSVFWTAIWVSLVAGIFAAWAGYSAASAYFRTMEGLPNGLLGEISAAKGWLAAIIPVVMLNSVLTGALQGYERFLAINIVNSSTSMAMAAVPLLIAYIYGPNLTGLVATILIVRICSLVALFTVILASLPVRRVRWISPSLLNALLTFGGWVTVDGIIASLLVTFDRFLIGRFLGAAAVSIYTIPFNLVSTIQIIPSALESVLFPRFASTNDGETSDLLAFQGVSTLAVIMAPVIVFGMAAVEPFLIVWIGSELAAESAPIAFIILFASWPNSIARIPYSRLLADGRPRLITTIHLLELPIYFGVLVLAATKLGVVGVAAAWSIRTTVDAIIFLILMKSRSAVFKKLMMPTLLVSATLPISLAFAVQSQSRWFLMSLILSCVILWAVRNMPDSLATSLDTVLRPIPVVQHLCSILKFRKS